MTCQSIHFFFEIFRKRSGIGEANGPRRPNPLEHGGRGHCLQWGAHGCIRRRWRRSCARCFILHAGKISFALLRLCVGALLVGRVKCCCVWPNLRARKSAVTQSVSTETSIAHVWCAGHPLPFSVVLAAPLIQRCWNNLDLAVSTVCPSLLLPLPLAMSMYAATQSPKTTYGESRATSGGDDDGRRRKAKRQCE
jgi:hypothetical protein